jgi:hypothetical protein
MNPSRKTKQMKLFFLMKTIVVFGIYFFPIHIMFFKAFTTSGFFDVRLVVSPGSASRSTRNGVYIIDHLHQTFSIQIIPW